MKHADCFLSRAAVALAFLASFVGVVGAQASSTTPVDTAAAANAATGGNSSLIHFAYDETPLDRSNDKILTSYADMLTKVTPAVVGIYPSRKVSATAGTVGGRFRRQQPPQPQDGQNDIFWTGEDNTQYRVLGVGSGCIVSPDGYIVTNNHVVVEDVRVPGGGGTVSRPADSLLVKLSDGREFEGKLVGTDAFTDLALIKINARNLPVLKLADSEKSKVGDVVFAVGNPMDVGLTVTHGIISATGRSNIDRALGDSSVAYEDFIQTDAPINPGNSGGPLVDVQGRLVGLNAAIVSSDGGSNGIGFAIPSALVHKVADDLSKDGHVHRGLLGVASMDVTHNIAQAWKLPNTHGAIVTEITPADSPAAKFGLAPGDVIVKVNDEEVDSSDKLRYLVALADPDTTVNLTVLRKDDAKDAFATKVFRVRLADRDQAYGSMAAVTQWAGGANPATPTPAPAAANPTEPLPGVSLMPFSADLSKQLDLPADIAGGLVVTDVARNSPYYGILGPGSVILQANGKPVTSYDNLRALLRPGDINVFYVYRTDLNGGNGKKSYVSQYIPAGK